MRDKIDFGVDKRRPTRICDRLPGIRLQFRSRQVKSKFSAKDLSQFTPRFSASLLDREKLEHERRLRVIGVPVTDDAQIQMVGPHDFIGFSRGSTVWADKLYKANALTRCGPDFEKIIWIGIVGWQYGRSLSRYCCGIMRKPTFLITARGHKTGGTVRDQFRQRISFVLSERDARSVFRPTAEGIVLLVHAAFKAASS